MTIDVDEGKKAEEQSRFLAQLQASLKVIRSSFIHEGEAAGRSRVPSIGRNHI